MSFEEDLVFLLTAGLEGKVKPKQPKPAWAQLFSCTAPEVKHQHSARLCAKPKGFSQPGQWLTDDPSVAVPFISSPEQRCWVWIMLIRTVKAPDKAQHSSFNTLKCHRTCFRQQLLFVSQGERELFYIRQFPLVWAFTGEQKPMMQLFLPRISIRNLDLALLHSFGSKWEIEQKSLYRRDFLKWKKPFFKEKTSCNTLWLNSKQKNDGRFLKYSIRESAECC